MSTVDPFTQLAALGYTPDDIILAKSSTFNFTTTFFKDPNDPEVMEDDLTLGGKWTPYDPQILLYDLLDFGYDIRHTNEKPTRAAEIITMLFPRQMGKTEGCSSAASSLAIRYPNSKIGIISAGDDAAKDFMQRIIYFIKYSPFSTMIKRIRADRIDLTNGSIIMSLPTSEKAIRGKSFTWVFVDEAAIIEDKAIDEWIFPTVDAKGAFKRRGTPSIILLSTPQGPRGRFYDYYVMGLEEREICCKGCKDRRSIKDDMLRTLNFHPRNIPELPPCPKCGHLEFEYVPNRVITVTLDPWNHPTRTPEELKEKLRVRGNSPSARQELLGEILVDESGVFMKEWLENCQDPEIHTRRIKIDYSNRYVMGVDFGKLHDATVICIGHIDGATVIMDYIFYLEGDNKEYSEIRHEVLAKVNLFRPSHLVLDATGLGNPIVEQISYDIYDLQTTGLIGKYKKKDGTYQEYEFKRNPDVYTKILSNKKNQLGFIFDYHSKADLIDNLSNLFQRGLIRIPTQFDSKESEILWKELINFGFEYSSANRVKYGTQRDHDDTVIGLALLAWGLRERPYYYVDMEYGGEDEYVLY